MSLSDLINAKTSPGGVAKANPAKTGQSEGRTLAKLARLAVATPRNEKNECHRRWRITEADGTAWTSSFCPPQDLAEVKARYPGALSCAPCPSPAQQPGAPLGDAEGARVRAWLASIGETDPPTIGEVLDRCEIDREARTYFLGRAGEVDTWDDRRTCRQCANLAKSGRCRAAGRGELLGTAKRYTPPPDTPRRCEGYVPGTSDPDRRPGRERWPG